MLMGSDVGERTAIRIGLLFSTTGPYATIGSAMRNGSMLAIGEVNADASFPFTLDPLEANPDGRNAIYAELACRMLTAERLVHVVGCYASSSRKEVLPYFEKYDGLLWYPSHYEGFESSEHVIYTGAAPNLAHCPPCRLSAATLRDARLLHRIELYLGMGKQQDLA